MNKPRIGLSLSCIDYRLFDATIELLRKDCQVDGFDHTILAGASLGYNQHDYKTWQRTWLDHVDLALKLHNIKVILVIDHQDCGFYKAIYKNAKDCEKCERALHIKNIKKFIRQVRKLYPQLEYRGYLLALDGSYETIYP